MVSILEKYINFSSYQFYPQHKKRKSYLAIILLEPLAIFYFYSWVSSAFSPSAISSSSGNGGIGSISNL